MSQGGEKNKTKTKDDRRKEGQRVDFWSKQSDTGSTERAALSYSHYNTKTKPLCLFVFVCRSFLLIIWDSMHTVEQCVRCKISLRCLEGSAVREQTQPKTLRGVGGR